MVNYLYKEEQKHATPWIWMIIFPVICLYLYFMFTKKAGSSFIEGDDLVGYIIICIVLFVMMVGLTILFYKMKLTTLINKDGIHIFFPPHKKDFFITRTGISSYKIIEYNSISIMKGFKLKSKLKQTAKAYTIAGKFGLVIYLSNGKKVLIDTNRKEAVRLAMNKLMKQE